MSNVKPPSSNLIATSNSFDLFSENIENSLDTSNFISIEDKQCWELLKQKQQTKKHQYLNWEKSELQTNQK